MGVTPITKISPQMKKMIFSKTKMVTQFFAWDYLLQVDCLP
jgi:hypothetical protein